MTGFRRSTLRANPAYSLVLLDRLPAEQRQAVRRSWSGRELYGILRPGDGTGLPLKAIDHQTALLFLTLQSPSPPPRYVFEQFGEDADDAIAELVLDGILEVRRSSGFVSGAAGVQWTEAHEDRAPGGVIADLSSRALRYAESLHLDDVADLTRRIYRFHRVPLTPAWSRKLPDRGAVARWLGTEPGSGLHRGWSASWTEGPGADGSGAAFWTTWGRTRAWTPRGDSRSYKLYISPTPDALPETLAAAVPVLTRTKAHSFKVAALPGECLRPDKLVAYFDTMEHLVEAGAALEGELRGRPVHGVPLTAELGLGGLLSWGIDPPQPDGGRSWRMWLASQIAIGLVAAHAADGEDRCRFTLDRLRSVGVDTDRWLPRSFLFTGDHG